jgi:hypothetical protein
MPRRSWKLPAPAPSEPQAPAEKAEGEQQPVAGGAGTTESAEEAFLRQIKEKSEGQWMSASLGGGG